MRYGSVCSGIEAASQAWEPLGWSPQFFSEIDAFPCAVLAHHYGSNLPGKPVGNGVPNHGDMTKFQEWPDHAIDLLVGGTPCQSFSIAGLRAGLADPRGNLMLTYLAVAAKYRPRWVVWENVPGVLSSGKGRDFGSFLTGLAELGYGVAYRILDAQYVRVGGFGRAVPQRRRRVFAVGYLGDWRRAAAVLFDGASLRGDPAPRREAGQNIAPTISARPTGGGGLGTDFDLDGGLIETPAVSVTLTARDRKGPLPEADLSTVIVSHALRADGYASEDGTGRGTPLVPVVAASLTRGAESAGKGGYAGRRQEDDVNILAIPFDTTQITHPENRSNPEPGDPAGTLPKGGHPPAVAYGIRSDAQRDGEAKTLSPDAEGKMRLRPPGLGITEGVSPTVDSSQPHAVAFSIMPMNSGKDYKARETEVAQPIMAGGPTSGNQGGDFIAQPAVQHGWAVRRLTPVECARLQGFHDDYLSQVTYRGKTPADGPMYKALGNSMAVNVMRWIGERIDMVDKLK